MNLYQRLVVELTDPKFVYGMDVLPENDPYVKLAEHFIHHFAQALVSS